MTDTPDDIYQWGAWFAVSGPAAWLSHHDTCRHWRRALCRADINLRYSAGFNPHPKMSLPAPRSVGHASRQELTLFETRSHHDAADLRRCLETQMPENVSLHRCGAFNPPLKALPTAAAYRLGLGETIDESNLDENIARFNQADTWPVLRAAHGRHPRRHIDIRPGVAQLRRLERNLCCVITFDAAGTCRIDELLAALDVPSDAVAELLREQVSYRVTQAGQIREVSDIAAFMALAQTSA